jgi:hypothetical protein
VSWFRVWLVGACICAEAADLKRIVNQNVLLITIDTLRADALRLAAARRRRPRSPRGRGRG